MKILIIGGGISSEREIALRSSRAVFEAALQKGYQAEFYDWDGSREWLTAHAREFSLALSILHGAGGEDGVIQSLLEAVKLPYLGSGVKASELCFDKQKTRQLLAENGVLVPSGQLVSFSDYQASQLFNQPHVLKPTDSGSSVDTYIYPDAAQKDMAQIKDTFARHPQMLLEEYISGDEVTVPVLIGKQLPIIEIIPPQNAVFDFANKYNGQTQELVPPEHVTPTLQESARQLGERVHELTGCRHLSRVDMIISGDDIYVLEVNTMPGLTDQSLFPKAAAAAGLSFPDFVDYLIKQVQSEITNV